MTWRVCTLLVAAALTVGFSVGYHVKDQATQAAVVKQTTAAVKQAGANIAESAVRSQQVEAAIQQTDSNIDQLKAAAQARLQKGKTHETTIRVGGNAGHDNGAGRIATATTTEQPGPAGDAADDCGSDRRLDFGTVRLLNRARDEGAVESAPGSAG